MPSSRLILSLVLTLAMAQLMVAQPSIDPFQYDLQIDNFFNNGQRDSFLYYNDLKAKACLAANDLATWAWVRLDGSEYLSEQAGDDLAAQQYLETAWAERWREPTNATEGEPFCYFQAGRGWYFAQNSKMLQAVQALEDAARYYEQFRFSDFDALESIYKPLGNCYTRLGDNDKALAVFLKSLLVTGDNDAMAGLYCNLGIAYWNKGDYEAAEKYHRQGLALPEVSRLKRALLLGALAQTLLDKGSTQQAASRATASLVLLAAEKSEKHVLKYRCFSRRTAGIANMRLGRLSEAERLLSGARADALTAFDSYSRELGKVEIARAELLLLQGKTLAALEVSNRALSSVLPGFQPTKPDQNPDAAVFYEENVIFEALALKANAAKLYYEKTGNLSWLELALRCHDLAWQAETRVRKIFQYSTSKLDLQSGARAREASAMQVARTLYEKTGQQVYLEKAFGIAERSKASLLSEALHDNLIRQRLADSDPRFSTLTTLRQNFSLFEKLILLEPGNAQVSLWRREADKLTTQVNTLESQIRTDYPELAEQRLATCADVNTQLQEAEAMMVYFVCPQTIEVFVFQKNKATLWQSLPNNVELHGLLGKYLAYFENQNVMLNDPAGYLNTAFLLWQKLLPAETANAAKLTIVPDGFLTFIPFDALVTSQPDNSTSLRNAAYVVRRQTVRYAWSFSVLRQQKSLHSNAKNYALSLAPGFADSQRGLATLSGDAAERPTNSDVLLNEAADLSHFMAAVGMYRVLHLSTHAIASVQDGQLPRLELFDQPLFLPNIYALPLQADLVTLSACQTGLGHDQSGEGVMSLARAFTQAGAACVVSSLWSVNDVSTSQLLANFYRKIAQGNSIGQALRSAKLQYLDDPEVRATMQSPYFWAGLTMVGDDRVIKGGASGWWLWAIGALALAGVFLWRFKKQTSS